MKQLITTLIMGLGILFATPPEKVQAQAKIYSFFSADTIKTVTSKTMTLNVGSPKGGIVEFNFDYIGGTLTGFATLQYSVSGIGWNKFPGTDSVTLASADITKLWIVKDTDIPLYGPPKYRILITGATASGAGGAYTGKFYK